MVSNDLQKVLRIHICKLAAELVTFVPGTFDICSIGTVEVEIFQAIVVRSVKNDGIAHGHRKNQEEQC